MPKMTDEENFDDLDISQIVPKERTVELTHPGTGEKLGITLNLMSADDPRLKRTQRALMDQRSERQRRNKIMTAEEMEAGMIKLLAQTITGWNWGERKWKGETPVYSTRTAMQLLTESEWIYKQVNDAVGDVAAFF